MNDHIFAGFGFGPIQSGLFAAEAFKSNRFKRIVIAEIDPALVQALRANHGRYVVNVASFDGIRSEHIDGIECFNPAIEQDRQELVRALSQATEIITALPSVDFYDKGSPSVVSLIRQGLQHRTARATLVYAAENNNHAARILEDKVRFRPAQPIQYLNTVIGKMSQVVTDKNEIAEKGLIPIAPGIDRAFLVEEFNRIYVTQCTLSGFTPGISVFIEKSDVLPFEEAKLYGHNAIHAVLAYLAARKGYTKMAELEHDAQVMQIARDAFINESGRALIKKYAHLNEDLFTPAGYRAFAEDLLKRMTNPWLDDTVERAARDPRRKLSENDRLFGTMRLCLEQGVEPANIARGVAAGIAYFIRQAGLAADTSCEQALRLLWTCTDLPYRSEVLRLVRMYF
ncbi:MAG: hypothetical protein JXB18_14825 [Sedimentisphaerales bacterium]|nr:hypothetical protein [Sedimentisphaerales bacterium]